MGMSINHDGELKLVEYLMIFLYLTTTHSSQPSLPPPPSSVTVIRHPPTQYQHHYITRQSTLNASVVVSLKEYGIVTILLLVVVLEQSAHLLSSTTHNNNPTCPLHVENNGVIKTTIILRATEWVVLNAETIHPLYFAWNEDTKWYYLLTYLPHHIPAKISTNIKILIFNNQHFRNIISRMQFGGDNSVIRYKQCDKPAKIRAGICWNATKEGASFETPINNEESISFY